MKGTWAGTWATREVIQEMRRLLEAEKIENQRQMGELLETVRGLMNNNDHQHYNEGEGNSNSYGSKNRDER